MQTGREDTMPRPWTVMVALCAAVCLIAPMAVAGEEAAEEEIKIKGKTLTQLLKQLNSSNRGLQVRASRAISEAPKELWPKIVPKLIPLLEADRENLRFVAAQALGNYGPVARAAVPKLVPMLKGTQFERNRAAAAKALGLILVDAKESPEVTEAAKALVAKFNEDYDQYSDVRREASRAIGMIGPAAKVAIPKMTKGLIDYKKHSQEHTMVRHESAWACGRMGPPAKEHMDRLISMLHQEGHDLPRIVWAIGEIGPVHDNVVPNIVDKLEKSLNLGRYEPHVFNSLEALTKFGPKAAKSVDFLIYFLKQERFTPRILEQTMKCLGAIGPKAKKALPHIRKYKEAKAINIRGVTQEQKEAIVKAAKEAEKAVSK
jgi:HEAT repeat protein